MMDADHHSDKVWHHGYQRFYPYFLDQFIGLSIEMLEIGYEKGNSIEMWESYLKNPIIDAIDIIDDPNDSRLRSYYNVNQNKKEELLRFATDKSNHYSFIIDDASHVPDHQWNTFIIFFELLSPGGVYIIEDIETSFWGKSNMFGFSFDANKTSIFERFKFVDNLINREFIPDSQIRAFGFSLSELELLMQIEMISYGHNCIIIVKKDKKGFEKYYRAFEDYRHKKLINSEVKPPLLKRIKNKMIKTFYANS